MHRTPRQLEMPPCVIDIEASGFGAGSYPIEVGTVLSDGSAYCSLISPEPDWRHWQPSAEAIHGISRETLREHGKPATAVAGTLNDLLRGRTVYTDAWYHDYQWLARLFDAANIQPTFKLEDLRKLLDDAAQSRWHATREQVSHALHLTRHRASNDAKVLQKTLLAVLSAAEPAL
jgi:DNA polymerase III epsilon subunit-like protein